MRTFKNFIGCSLNFDDDISQAEIDKRLNLFGGNWIEVNEPSQEQEPRVLK